MLSALASTFDAENEEDITKFAERVPDPIGTSFGKEKRNSRWLCSNGGKLRHTT